MFSILSVVTEVTLMVLEPTYRTHKELQTLFDQDVNVDNNDHPDDDETPGNGQGLGDGEIVDDSQSPDNGEVTALNEAPDDDKDPENNESPGNSEVLDDGKGPVDGAVPDDAKDAGDGKDPNDDDPDFDDKGPSKHDHLMERRWLLIHWIVYASYNVVDFVARSLLPMYDVISIVTVLWLRLGGSEKVYRSFIEPFLAERELVIDRWLERFSQAKDTMTDASAVLSVTAAAATSAATRIVKVDADMDTNTGKDKRSWVYSWHSI